MTEECFASPMTRTMTGLAPHIEHTGLGNGGHDTAGDEVATPFICGSSSPLRPAVSSRHSTQPDAYRKNQSMQRDAIAPASAGFNNMR